MRLYPLNWIQWLTLALAMSIAVCVPVLFFRIEAVQHHQNDALRSIMCHAEQVVQKQPGIPAKQRREALHFYRSSLRDAHLSPCEPGGN